MDVIYRGFKVGDGPKLSRIVTSTWDFDKGITDPFAASRPGLIYLYSCLKNGSFIEVAEHDGQPVGIVIGRTAKVPMHPGFSTRLAAYKLHSHLDSELREFARKWTPYFEAYDELDEETGAASGAFDAEIVLFIVSDSMRGKGVGKRLFNDALDFFRESGAESFFLHTDTDCNFEFYERFGMERLAERRINIPGEEELGVYSYGMRVF